MMVWDEPTRQGNQAKHGMDFVDLDEEFFLSSTVLPAQKGRYMAKGRSKMERLPWSSPFWERKGFR